MDGIIVKISTNKSGSTLYGVRKDGIVFGADPREIEIRQLHEGEIVTFATNRDTGKAILGDPPPKIGAEALRSG